MKRKRSSTSSERGSSKRRKKNKCSLVICNDEECHHFRVIEFLSNQRNPKIWPGMYFYASLMPYQRVWEHTKYGIRKGDPDFMIVYPYTCPKTGKSFCGLGIELKVKGGSLTPAEKIILRDTIKQDKILIAVCFGWKAVKKVALAYKRQVEFTKLDQLCWSSGPIKKESI